MTITVIGAGLAGAEAARTLSRSGFKVRLHEMKPRQFSPAHKYYNFAELVCSNSLKADRLSTSAGLLKAEMRMLGSLTLEAAELTRVPAGGALAVDRTAFSDEITRRIKSDPNIEVIHGEVTEFPESNTIIATGPLTSDLFAQAIKTKLASMFGKSCETGMSTELLGFYDAAAPIVTAESINMEKAFAASRYNKDDADYINCPFTREEYEIFYNALITAESAPLHDFDKPNYYEGCMPVEVLAKRGFDSVRYGCMKPVGIYYPEGYVSAPQKSGQNRPLRPFANVQLRKENKDGTLYNIVGFQTNLKFGEQKQVFSLIPGLENAEFVRYGVMHRNTFLDSPRLLDRNFMLRNSDNIYFAGQITGVEGYMESAASGILAARAVVNAVNNKVNRELPPTTMLGALTRYVCGADSVFPADCNISTRVSLFQPMGANMGLLPPLETRAKKKAERYERLHERAVGAIAQLKIEN
jgi:methylenetetrahydrofolate--tRNA-(uracil-5-)-methyltransferase